jgi:hypothetical protein
MRLEAYYNLHKKCISARPIGGYVKHYEFLCLDDASFSVQPAGRKKVLKEKKKNVHAFVRGNLLSGGEQRQRDHDYDGVNIDLSVDRFREDARYDEVTYNPYKYESFVRKHNEEPVQYAPHVWIIDKHIFIPSIFPPKED